MLEIKGFFNEFRFLSNYHLIVINYEGIEYPSTEHAFQAAKSFDVKVRQYIADLVTPKEARLAGKEIILRDDWESVKLQVMTDVSRIKFQDPVLKEKLLATGDAYLEETNSWKDDFWGKCSEAGQNHLGKILMMIRQELQEQENLCQTQ